jgi:outer membrane biogenesis lipoprotein LolB
VELTGRMNVVYQKDDKPESATGNFNWQQTAQHRRHLISPTGQTVASSRHAAGHAEGKRQAAAARPTSIR